MAKVNNIIKLSPANQNYTFIIKGLTNTYNSSTCVNRIGGVMVSVLASSAVDVGLSPSRVKPRIMKLVFVASPLSTQH